MPEARSTVVHPTLVQHPVPTMSETTTGTAAPAPGNTSPEGYLEWLGNHHELIDHPEGPIHVFSSASVPIIRPSPVLWAFNVHWILYGFTWFLRGTIDLTSLNISADFSLAVPLLNLAKLATVKGPLRGQGTRVDFHIGLTQGWARFYEHDGYLYVEMSVTELFRRTLPGKPQTIRLIRLPVAAPKLQFLAE
ncbi:hypothetical protein BC826DRAFT_128208 [Russula brevipes]|nr:hypothetical protein BC826DRAFT_128208 [Russula brevipes]